ncbi:monooxygenase [Polyangium jinanense]|uniref:Copper type II ascorbate-dependent monooxygenase C-terminal domain-containing protein n=1 Tax=Polyangium jinanense TaxID=2829994 RepID=A0A9X4ARQ8_9BACT|nr:hypothetical protein [Polyangium jinanense]MDC3981756.1 hypothetical protein [Polyangium jinanense]
MREENAWKRRGFGFVFVGCVAAVVPACGSEPERTPTWYRDIQPLVDRSCAACHDGSGVGRVNLRDAATARALAGTMAARVESGEMPPPALDPSCRPYAGAEKMYLGPDDRARFRAWADAGAPLGDPSEATTKPGAVAHIDDPDLVLEMPEAHEVTPDDDGNEYWCVVLDNPLATPAWIQAIEAVPGDPLVVHHIGLYRDAGHDAGAGYGVPPGTKGFSCRDPVLELDWQLLHAFAPGVGVMELPKDTGIRLDPGEQIVIQMHYYAPKSGALDRSAYRMRLATEAPAAEVFMDVFGPVPFTIPAGASQHVERSVITNEGPKATIYGLLPHMHLLGRSYDAWIEDDAGANACVARGDFDFHHQALYMFDEPIPWQPGQRFVTECTWDNSATGKGQTHFPPLDIAWGEGTNQEMCFMVAYLSRP